MSQMKQLRGIDVSEHQYAGNTVIDWGKVAQQIDFAYIRTGDGTYRDKRFDVAIQGAIGAGVPVGVYHYTRAMNVQEAVNEAKQAVAQIKPYKVTWGIALDLEAPAVVQLPAKQIMDIVLAWCDTVAEAGYIPILYTTCSTLNSKIDKRIITQRGIVLWVTWSANRASQPQRWEEVDGKDPLTKHPWSMWQFCTTAHIDGIIPAVDLDTSFVDLGRRCV